MPGSTATEPSALPVLGRTTSVRPLEITNRGGSLTSVTSMVVVAGVGASLTPSLALQLKLSG